MTPSANTTRERFGPFWDSVLGRSPLPPAAATLGLELIDADVENGTIEVAFAATEDFSTPRGDVLEGFLAAMLHDVVGPAVLATLEPNEFISTLHLNAIFQRPAFPGRIVGRGRVVHRDGDLHDSRHPVSVTEGLLASPSTSTS
jgi:acyl-coenzyme A thioesterase PaaI-like protein